MTKVWDIRCDLLGRTDMLQNRCRGLESWRSSNGRRMNTGLFGCHRQRCERERPEVSFTRRLASHALFRESHSATTTCERYALGLSLCEEVRGCIFSKELSPSNFKTTPPPSMTTRERLESGIESTCIIRRLPRCTPNGLGIVAS